MSNSIGCAGVGCVVGAEALTAASGVWMKVRFYRDGDFLCATVYSVAAGEPKVVDLRVDTRPIARSIMRAHAALHARDAAKQSLRSSRSGAAPSVGWGLGSLWKGAKKAAKAIGRNKLVKGVVGVTKAIAKGAKAVVTSKVFGAALAVASFAVPITAPFGTLALGAYASANTAIAGVEAGKAVSKTAASAASTIARGKKAKAHAAKQKKTAHAAVKQAGAKLTPTAKVAIAAKVKAAGSVKLSAQGKVTLAASMARLPVKARAQAAAKVASNLGKLGELRSRAALAKALPASARAALLASTHLELQAGTLGADAAAVAKRLADPAVKKRLLDIKARGDKSQALLAAVQVKAQAGSLDAQKSAAIINLVARNRARIQAMSQANAGGLPGLLITPQGRLVRGRFRVQATASTQGLLYQGPGKPGSRGAFATVSGNGTNALVGRRLSGCYDVGGDLPLDGVRLSAPGPNAHDIGKYDWDEYAVSGRLIGCASDCSCAPS